MGTITSDVKCELCSGVAMEIRNWKTGEEDISCRRCGHVHSSFIKRTEDGEVIFKNGSPIIETVTSPGYGVYAIFQTNGVGEIGCFHEPITEETIQQFHKTLEETDIDTKNSYLAKWEDGKQTFLFGETDSKEVLLDYDVLIKVHQEESEKEPCLQA